MSDTLEILQGWQRDPDASDTAVADLLDRFFSGDLPKEDDKRIFDFMAADEAFGTMIGRMLEAEARFELALDREAQSFRRFREGLVSVGVQVVDGVPSEFEVESAPEGAMHEARAATGEGLTLKLGSPRGASIRVWGEKSSLHLAVKGFPRDWPAPVVNLTRAEDGEALLLRAEQRGQGGEWLLSASRLPDGAYTASIPTTAPKAGLAGARERVGSVVDEVRNVVAEVGSVIAEVIGGMIRPLEGSIWTRVPVPAAQAAGPGEPDAGRVHYTGPDGVTITLMVVGSQSAIRVCIQDVPEGKDAPRVSLLRTDDPSLRQDEEPVLQEDTGEYVAVFYGIEPDHEYAVVLEGLDVAGGEGR